MRRQYSDSEIVEGTKAEGMTKELILLWLCNHGKYIKHSTLTCKKIGIIDSSDQRMIFNDSLLELCRAIEEERYIPSQASVLTYWKGIHRHLCLKYLNKNPSTPPSAEIKEHLSLSVPENDSFMYYNLIAEFEKKSTRCAEMLKLVAAGYQAAEIAKKMGYGNANTVGVVKSRCLKSLRKFIKDDERR